MVSGAAAAGSKSADPLRRGKQKRDLAENILRNCDFTLTQSAWPHTRRMATTVQLCLDDLVIKQPIGISALAFERICQCNLTAAAG